MPSTAANVDAGSTKCSTRLNTAPRLNTDHGFSSQCVMRSLGICKHVTAMSPCSRCVELLRRGCYAVMRDNFRKKAKSAVRLSRRTYCTQPLGNSLPGAFSFLSPFPVNARQVTLNTNLLQVCKQPYMLWSCFCARTDSRRSGLRRLAKQISGSLVYRRIHFILRYAAMTFLCGVQHVHVFVRVPKEFGNITPTRLASNAS